LYKKARLCSLNPVLKSRPVCPTYALLQSRHVRLYTPDSVNLLGICVWQFKCASKPLLVQQAMFRSVCLNNFVMYLVSLPTYVKVGHDRFVGVFYGGVCGRVGASVVVVERNCCVRCYG
jgi:hypothetical protein